jgi:hypothetical protein
MLEIESKGSQNDHQNAEMPKWKFNRTECNRHLFLENSCLSCHRCLKNTGAEEINSNGTALFKKCKQLFGVPKFTHT